MELRPLLPTGKLDFLGKLCPRCLSISPVLFSQAAFQTDFHGIHPFSARDLRMREEGVC